MSGQRAVLLGLLLEKVLLPEHFVLTTPSRCLAAELDKAWMPGTHCTDDNPCLKPEGNPLWQQRVTFIQGLPDSPEVLTQVQELINKWGAKTVFVSEDSSHMYDTVLSNLKTYAKFVTSGR